MAQTVFLFSGLPGVHPSDKEGFRLGIYAWRVPNLGYKENPSLDLAFMGTGISAEAARHTGGFQVTGAIRFAILQCLHRMDTREVVSINVGGITFGETVFIPEKRLPEV